METKRVTVDRGEPIPPPIKIVLTLDLQEARELTNFLGHSYGAVFDGLYDELSGIPELADCYNNPSLWQWRLGQKGPDGKTYGRWGAMG